MHHSHHVKSSSKPKGFFKAILNKPRSTSDIGPSHRRKRSPLALTSDQTSPLPYDGSESPRLLESSGDKSERTRLPPLRPPDTRIFDVEYSDSNESLQIPPLHMQFASTSRSDEMTPTSSPRMRFKKSSSKSHSRSKSGEGSADKSFLKRFPELPQETILHEANCAFLKKVLIQGILYLTRNYLLFFSPIGMRHSTRVIISLQQIVELKRARTIGIISNAISVRTSDKRYFFTSFLSRDATLNKINTLLLSLSQPQSSTGSSDRSTGSESDADQPETPVSPAFPPTNSESCVHFPQEFIHRDSQYIFAMSVQLCAFSSLSELWERAFGNQACSAWTSSPAFTSKYQVFRQTEWEASPSGCCLNRYLHYSEGSTEFREHQVINAIADGRLSLFSAVNLTLPDESFLVEAIYNCTRTSEYCFSVELSYSCDQKAFSPQLLDIFPAISSSYFSFLETQQQSFSSKLSSSPDSSPRIPDPASLVVPPAEAVGSSLSQISFTFKQFIGLVLLILLFTFLSSKLISINHQYHLQSKQNIQLLSELNQLITLIVKEK